jgi:hypothetical protein
MEFYGDSADRVPQRNPAPVASGPLITFVDRAAEQRTAQLHRLARYAATLTRLASRIERLSHSQERPFGCHLRATWIAYDQTLLLAMHEMGHVAPERAPLSATDRLSVEAELVLAGLRW